jgi:hypothetical protein
MFIFFKVTQTHGQQTGIHLGIIHIFLFQANKLQCKEMYILQ